MKKVTKFGLEVLTGESSSFLRKFIDKTGEKVFCLQMQIKLKSCTSTSVNNCYLVYTKTVDSVFRALWLATHLVNILHYSLIHLQFLQASDAKLA